MTVAEFDFIVVGGGPCGSSLASRLADAAAKPSVLLIEAGGTNDGPESHVAGQRNTYWLTSGTKLDHGYKTVPQLALNNRELPYHRGKCLGGSTATNIGVWDYGSKPELDEWAKRVNDDRWAWDNVSKRLSQIETYHNNTPREHSRYVNAETSDNAMPGPVHVAHAGVWDPTLPLVFEAIEAHGIPLNPDLSSEKCIGMGVAPATVEGDLRVTASTSYLRRKRANLRILTNTTVQKILFEGLKARAVYLGEQGIRYASKEIVLCAGAIDTPKLLLLSGIGPGDELARYHIPVILDQPYIGKDLKDHPMIRLGATVTAGALSARPLPPAAHDIAAAAQGYLKINTSKLPATSSIDQKNQSYVLNDRTPTHELLLRIVPAPATPDHLLWLAVIVLMNCKSRGTVSLQSSHPSDPPLIDLQLLSDPYDFQLAIETIRATIPLLRQSSVIPTDGMAIGPDTTEDADIEEYIRANMGHLWHACGTVKMGKTGQKGTCVTSDFRLHGLNNLRVADLSIAPLIPSNHIQSTGYLIGEYAADTLIDEYSLNS